MYVPNGLDGRLLRYRVGDNLVTKFPGVLQRLLAEKCVLVIESTYRWESGCHEYLARSLHFPRKEEGEDAPLVGVEVGWQVFEPGLEHDVEQVPVSLCFLTPGDPNRNIYSDTSPHPAFSEEDLRNLADASFSGRFTIREEVRARVR